MRNRFYDSFRIAANAKRTPELPDSRLMHFRTGQIARLVFIDIYIFANFIRRRFIIAHLYRKHVKVTIISWSLAICVIMLEKRWDSFKMAVDIFFEWTCLCSVWCFSRASFLKSNTAYYENLPGPNPISRVCFSRNGTYGSQPKPRDYVEVGEQKLWTNWTHDSHRYVTFLTHWSNHMC